MPRFSEADLLHSARGRGPPLLPAGDDSFKDTAACGSRFPFVRNAALVTSQFPPG